MLFLRKIDKIIINFGKCEILKKIFNVRVRLENVKNKMRSRKYEPGLYLVSKSWLWDVIRRWIHFPFLRNKWRVQWKYNEDNLSRRRVQWKTLVSPISSICSDVSRFGNDTMFSKFYICSTQIQSSSKWIPANAWFLRTR